MMWLHFMLDLSGSSLLFVFFASPSFSFSLLIHLLRFTTCHFLTMTHFQVCYSLCIIITHLIISLIFFIASLLLSYSHWAPSGPWLTRFSIHVAFHTWGHEFFIIGYLGLVSLHFYYPSLRYVLRFKTTLRSWDQMSSLTTPTWTGVWDLVNIWMSSTSSSGRRFFDV